MFQLQRVDKSFADASVLRQFDLDIRPKQTTVLIGPSGCGKSTILRLMLGLVGPDSGRVQFDINTVHPGTVRKIRQRIGYVIQDGGLFPHMTAGQNVTIMARQHGWQKRAMEYRVDELCEMTKFPREGLSRFPVELSGGQQQRVALMRALMLDPDVLLLDEPLGALDPLIRFDLQRDLRAIFRTLGQTVVLVTHDLAEAAFFADDIVLLRDGRIIQRGTINSMLDQPADPFVSRFVRAQRVQLNGETVAS